MDCQKDCTNKSQADKQDCIKLAEVVDSNFASHDKSFEDCMDKIFKGEVCSNPIIKGFHDIETIWKF